MIIDEVVRKIYEEDARAREAEMQKKQEQRRYIEEFKGETKIFETLNISQYLLESNSWTNNFENVFLEQQEIWNAQEKQRLQKEAEQIKLYEEEQKRRTQERMAKKEEDQSAKIAVQEALAKKLKEEQVKNY